MPPTGTTPITDSSPEGKVELPDLYTERTLTVEPLPQLVQALGGGIVLDVGYRHTRDESLQLAADGHTVLIPQPTDDPNDPLNWSWRKKHIVLFTVAWAACVADWTSASGPTVIFQQAVEWGISPTKANRPNSINILFGGIGGLIWVPLSNWWGRAPVLFWTAICGFAASIGAAAVPTYEVHFSMRVLTALFLTSGQTMTIAFLKDMFFFHERARKIGLWACLYIASPYLGPCISSFVIHETGDWADNFWICASVAALNIIFVLIFIDESWYDRQKHQDEQPHRTPGFIGRLQRISGIWQIQHHSHYFPTTSETMTRFAKLITRPAFALIFINYLMCFAWAIGINITATILFATPVELGGYGYSNRGVGFLYFIPIVGVFVGEIIGHFWNEWITRQYVKTHNGVYEPEVRLWMVYISIFIGIPSLVLVGAGLEYHLNVAAIIFGWGMFSLAIMTMSVAVTAYSMESFPLIPAEIGGWLTFARTLGGFSIGYFQSPWVNSVGALGSLD